MAKKTRARGLRRNTRLTHGIRGLPRRLISQVRKRDAVDGRSVHKKVSTMSRLSPQGQEEEPEFGISIRWKKFNERKIGTETSRAGDPARSFALLSFSSWCGIREVKGRSPPS